MEKTRRAFFKDIARGYTTAQVAMWYGPPLVPAVVDRGVRAIQEQTQPEGEKIGQKLRNWKAANGEKMTSISPEVADAARIYEAQSLDYLFPIYKGRVGVTYVDALEPGKLIINQTFYEEGESPFKITSSGPNVKPFNTRVLKDVAFRVEISKSLKGKNAELAVLAKEAIQIRDLVAYSKMYKKLVEAGGSKIEVENPDNSTQREDLGVLSWGILQQMITNQDRSYNWLNQFIDSGSHLNTGGIAYKNWWLSNPGERRSVTTNFVVPGERVSQFLMREGLLVERNGVAKWKDGIAPDVNSEQFAQLYSKYSGAPLRNS